MELQPIKVKSDFRLFERMGAKRVIDSHRKITGIVYSKGTYKCEEKTLFGHEKKILESIPYGYFDYKGEKKDAVKKFKLNSLQKKVLKKIKK